MTLCVTSWLSLKNSGRPDNKAEIFEDAETKNVVWYDLLGSIFSGPDDPNYVVCKITPYRIEYHTMAPVPPDVWET